jgi:hypothetical protein
MPLKRGLVILIKFFENFWQNETLHLAKKYPIYPSLSTISF